jgi:hypothetical protein
MAACGWWVRRHVATSRLALIRKVLRETCKKCGFEIDGDPLFGNTTENRNISVARAVLGSMSLRQKTIYLTRSPQVLGESGRRSRILY